jgi:uncharacterized protein (TIGR03083 family)
MDHAAYCDALVPVIDGFAASIRGVDPATPVVTCAPWDIGQLAKHIGMIHRWATRMVRDRVTQRLSPREIDMGMPSDRRDYADWVAAGAADLVTTLRAADPDAAMWAWGTDQHVRFWSRRMLHETIVHRADAQISLGQTIEVDAAVAIDGVDEFFENLAPAASFSPKVDNLRGEGQSIHLHCTDADGEWMVELAPEGFRWSHGHGKGTVAIRGAATDLLLLVYGRYRADDETRFARFGDAELFDWWIANSALE